VLQLNPRCPAEVIVVDSLLLTVTDRHYLPVCLPPRVQSTDAAFHSSSTIFPVGYTATCTYLSAVTPGATTRYTATIAEGSGSGSALFVVVAADAPGRQWVATSAAGVGVCVRVGGGGVGGVFVGG